MVDRLLIATSVQEALKLKSESDKNENDKNENDKNKTIFLAGGTEINRLGSTQSAGTLISIGRIKELDGITTDGDSVRIGAMCTFQDIIDSDKTPDYLKEACRFMGSRTKRNMATIGGNVALRRTDSYLYATLLACAAKLELMSEDGSVLTKCVCCYLKRHDEFKDMLITAITVPSNATVYSKRYANTVQSHAVLTVALGKTPCCEKASLRLAVAAKDTALTRLDDISEALETKDLTDDEIKTAIEKNEDLKFKDDIYGSPEYKRYLLAVTIADLAKKVKGGRA